MHEVHSYIWSDEKKNDELGIKTPENVTIINAQTPDHAHIRVSMIPTLLSFVKENKGYNDDFSLFEIGHTVEGLREDGYCNEQNKLGAVLYSKTLSEEELFLKARDAVEELCFDILHLEPTFSERDEAYDFEHPVNTFNVLVGGEVIGYLSVPYPTVLDNIDKKSAVAFFEISTEKFAKIKAASLKYKEPSKFPAIDIDVTFSTDVSSVDFPQVRRVATETCDILRSVFCKDIYTEEDGTSALTLRFSFASAERTLTKNELTPFVDAITTELVKIGLNVK
jgi:phenylalanyl-tRNA synthetase beta chain